MKLKLRNEEKRSKFGAIRLALAIGIAAALPADLLAQQYEYEPDEGLHQEEWYDPSDWFDTDPGIDYELDGYYDYYANYNYDGYYDDYGLFEDYDLPSSDAGENYGWHYEWDPVNDEWTSDYGYHTQTYNFDTPNDYGWHYDWNPNLDSWVRDYGYHLSNFDYDYSRFNYGQRDRQQGRSGSDIAREPRRKAQTQERQRAAQTRGQGQGRHTIQGTVDAFREVDLQARQGARAQHSWVRIELRNGKMVIVDLGPRLNVEDLDLNRGDMLRIQGRTGRVGNRSVLMAERINVDGQTRTIDRMGGRQRRQGRQQGQQASMNEQQERQSRSQQRGREQPRQSAWGAQQQR